MQQNTALLVMDMQTVVLASLPSPQGVIENVAKAIAKARENQVPVIYIVVGFRQGTPEIGPANKTFWAHKEWFAQVGPQEFIQIHPAVAPGENEITIIKRRISAFAGSDLEVILRAMDIKRMVLTGVATSGVVLSTLREAADKDYGLTVLADCCADSDEEVHRVLSTKIFPRQADVLNVDEWE